MDTGSRARHCHEPRWVRLVRHLFTRMVVPWLRAVSLSRYGKPDPSEGRGLMRCRLPAARFYAAENRTPLRVARLCGREIEPRVEAKRIAKFGAALTHAIRDAIDEGQMLMGDDLTFECQTSIDRLLQAGRGACILRPIVLP